MAINEVKLNGQVLLSTRGDTVTKATLIKDETATNKAGEKIKGEAHIPEKVSELENDVPYAKAEDIPTKLSDLENDTNFVQEENTYLLTDEEGDIADNDYIPFNDVSDENNSKKKTLFSNIVENIRNKFLSVFWAVKGGTEILSNANLNDYKDTGNYVIKANTIASTVSNIPVGVAGRLIVVDTTGNSTSYRTQIYYPHNANYSYTRHTTNGTDWSNWITSYASIQGVSHVHNYRNGLWWSQFKHKINGDKHLYLNFSKDGGVTWDGDSKIPLMSDILPHTYELGTDIPTGSDFNNYKTAGVYYVQLDSTASDISNMPVSRAGKLVVSKTTSANNYLLQTFYANASTNVYERYYNPNRDSWSDWKQLASIDDISPANIGNGYAVATVSGSAITATISGFKLRAGAIVALRFNNEVTVDSTLNISSTGAKSVRYWADETISQGKSIKLGLTTFIYDGTYYRIISLDRTPAIGQQGYVANTSGNILFDWGYGVNRAQIKYNIGSNKLLWNYYKNSTWRGDVELLDSLNGILATENLTDIASLDDIPVNTVGRIEFTSASGLSPLESLSIRGFFYTCFTPTSDCKVLTLTRFNPTFTNSSSKWERVNNGSGWTPYWVDYTPRGTYVGTCTTAGGTKDKVATVDSDFKLIKGVRVAIKFTNSNTYNSQPTSPVTLNVNNTGAKNIWGWSNHSGAGNTGTYTLFYGYAGRYKYYVYDGTYWVYDGQSGDENSTNFLRNDASSTLVASGGAFLDIKSSTIDITQANNGVSETLYPAYIIQDKNGKDMTRLETVVETNGQIRTFLQVCNYNTNTSAHFRAGITMFTNKSQDMWYSFTNPHYVNAALGNGYATCDTAEATTAKVASLPRYIISTNGYVTVRFTNAVPANSTLNINSQGVRNIYYHGSPIVNGVIRANDCATFIYSGGNYILVGIDRTNDITYSTTLSAGATQVTFTGLPTSGNYLNDIYTSKAGLNYKSLDDSTSGQLKVTFDAQTSAVTVYLKQEII